MGEATIRSLLKRGVGVMPDPLRLLGEIWHYHRQTRRVGLGDEPDLRFLEEFVKPGMHVVDIGANLGVYTRMLSRLVGPAGRVFAFEPVPRTFALLSAKVVVDGLANVTLLNAAISNVDGQCALSVPDGNFYRAAVAEAGLSATVTATRWRLDALFAERLPRISFIKCDVEGHEAECVEGAARLTRAARPTWLIEVHGDPDERGSDAHEFFERMVAAGYRVYVGQAGVLRERGPGLHGLNYFFVPDPAP